MTVEVSRSYLGDEIADDFRCLTATVPVSASLFMDIAKAFGRIWA
jgi:hypothetical protein